MNEPSIEDRIRSLPLPLARRKLDSRVETVFVPRRRLRAPVLVALTLAANVVGILIGWNVRQWRDTEVFASDPPVGSVVSMPPASDTVVAPVNREHLLALCTPAEQTFETFSSASPELVIRYSPIQETQ